MASDTSLPPSPPRTGQAIYQEAVWAATIGLIANLVLGVLKLTGGWLSGSFALLSDAVNSLGDSMASIVVLVAFRVAQRPADKEHPYGHTRAESIAASQVALLIILSALFVGWEAIRQWSLPQVTPPLWALGLAAGNVVIKEILYRFKVRVGERTGSTALIANAWDHRNDALCSLAVLIGLGLMRFGGERFAWADEAAALVVVLAILVNGWQLFRRSTSELLDLQADDGLVEAIRAEALRTPGVEVVETLWVRKSGLEFFVDMHIEVDARLTVAEGHQIGHAMKDAILERFPTVRDVLVHLEPYPHHHT